MEIINMIQSVVDSLLGQQVTSISRIAIVENESSDVLNDILIFILDDGKEFELLTQQTKTIFKEINSYNDLFVDFELEPDEILKTYSINEEILNIPFRIDSVTDVWASEGETKFLVAIILWDISRQPLLSICTETDEIELMTIDNLRQRINTMVFSYKCVEQRWYENKL